MTFSGSTTYGHATGDRAIQAVAQCLRSAIRPYDLASRFGGEEFLLVFFDVEAEMMTVISERIRKSISETPISTEDGSTIHVTCSIGVTVSELDQPIDKDALISLADKALYQAKESGRNRVVRL